MLTVRLSAKKTLLYPLSCDTRTRAKAVCAHDKRDWLPYFFGPRSTDLPAITCGAFRTRSVSPTRLASIVSHVYFAGWSGGLKLLSKTAHVRTKGLVLLGWLSTTDGGMPGISAPSGGP